MFARRLLIAGLITALAFAATAAVSRSGGHARVAAIGRGGGQEALESDALTAERLDALSRAKASGKFGGPVAGTTRPASGWVGSRILNPSTDDWGPAVATDPGAPYAYLLTTRYRVAPPGCEKQCPSPFIALTSSADGGSTWDSQRALCIGLGSKAQYDPIIEVVPKTGVVYAAFLNADRHNGFSTVFQKSTDHGQTWTDPVHVYGQVAWT